MERALATPNGVYFFVTPEIRVLSMWGAPDLASAELLRSVLAFELSPRCPQHASLLDVRDLSAIHPEVYSHLEETMTPLSEWVAPQIVASALVHKGGIAGALAAGFLALLPDTFERAQFRTLEQALRWFGVAPTLAQDIEHLRVEAREGDASLVSELRNYLRTSCREATLDTCARALKTSTRSLQRSLSEKGTSLRDELSRARLFAAKELLMTTDMKLLSVAERVGFSSAHSLLDLFRKAEGVSPDEWRKRCRSDDWT
jgi:AraC-like DNA-binding protein